MGVATGYRKVKKVYIGARIEPWIRDAIVHLGRQHKTDFTSELVRLILATIPKALIASLRAKYEDCGPDVQVARRGRPASPAGDQEERPA